MLLQVTSLLSQWVKPSDVLIIGVSGGPDSTALLDILVQFSKKTSLRLIVAHVNHGIRGKAAARDEKFVKKIARQFGLPCETKRVTLKGQTGLEEKGRNIRRSFFEQLLKKYHARFIVTAHTQDDQLETIVMNFLRGSGVAGLAGMKMVNGSYFKPFLGISKKEILHYLKQEKIPFCKDDTNEDTRFRRNFIRKKILPLFEKVNPGFRKAVLRNSALFAALEEQLGAEAKTFLERHQKGSSLFPLKAYERLPEGLQTAVIQEAYRMFQKTSYALPFINVQEVQRLMARRIGGKRIFFPGKRGGLLLKKGLVYVIERS